MIGRLTCISAYPIQGQLVLVIMHAEGGPLQGDDSVVGAVGMDDVVVHRVPEVGLSVCADEPPGARKDVHDGHQNDGEGLYPCPEAVSIFLHLLHTQPTGSVQKDLLPVDVDSIAIQEIAASIISP